MQQEFWYCHAVALHYSKRFLPETLWDDCASDFRLHIRSKAGSDAVLAFWFETSPAFINHCARQYIMDCAKKLSHRHEVSICHRFNNEAELTEWDIPDFRNLPANSLNSEEFWFQIASFSDRLPKRTLDFLFLHYRNELSHAEIAAKTGLKVNAVSQILSRALRTISAECEAKGISKGDFDPSSFAGGGRNLPKNLNSGGRGLTDKKCVKSFGKVSGFRLENR